MKIRAMQLEDMEEVVGMMRVFYDSPAVIHVAPDEILRQDVKDCVGECPYIEGYIFEEDRENPGLQHGGKELFYRIRRYVRLGGRPLYERRSERAGNRHSIFPFS